jgi:hypothetical protein
MTIDEYKTWKATRGDDAAQWKREDCVAADRLVKEETIKRLEAGLLDTATPTRVGDYVILMATHHFGSVETDKFLESIGAYPDWI